MNKYERNFKEKLRLGNDALFWIRLANDSYFELKNQMTGLATILLPLTASIVVISKDSRVKFVDGDKMMILAGWFSLGLSMLMGLWQTWLDSDFFRKLSNDSSLREHFRNNLRPNEAERVMRLLPSAQSKSSHTPLFLQTLFLLGGLFLIMSVAVSLLWRIN